MTCDSSDNLPPYTRPSQAIVRVEQKRDGGWRIFARTENAPLCPCGHRESCRRTLTSLRRPSGDQKSSQVGHLGREKEAGRGKDKSGPTDSVFRVLEGRNWKHLRNGLSGFSSYPSCSLTPTISSRGGQSAAYRRRSIGSPWDKIRENVPTVLEIYRYRFFIRLYISFWTMFKSPQRPQVKSVPNK